MRKFARRSSACFDCSSDLASSPRQSPSGSGASHLLHRRPLAHHSTHRSPDERARQDRRAACRCDREVVALELVRKLPLASPAVSARLELPESGGIELRLDAVPTLLNADLPATKYAPASSHISRDAAAACLCQSARDGFIGTCELPLCRWEYSPTGWTVCKLYYERRCVLISRPMPSLTCLG